MRLIPQISAYYWYRYRSCLRLIIWFLGTGKWFFVLENHFLVPWKQTIRNFEMPTCVDICNAMAEVGAICSIRWINWNKIHKTKNKTQNSIVIFGIFHKKLYCYFCFFLTAILSSLRNCFFFDVVRQSSKFKMTDNNFSFSYLRYEFLYGAIIMMQ